MDSTYSFLVKKNHDDSSKPLSKDLFSLTQARVIFEKYEGEIKVTWLYGKTDISGPAETTNQLGQEFFDEVNIYEGVQVEFLSVWCPGANRKT